MTTPLSGPGKVFARSNERPFPERGIDLSKTLYYFYIIHEIKLPCRQRDTTKGKVKKMAKGDGLQVNFFRPSTKNMKAETGIARTIILAWLLLSYGIPLVIWLAGL
jgi:hypothetical protein